MSRNPPKFWRRIEGTTTQRTTTKTNQTVNTNDKKPTGPRNPIVEGKPLLYYNCDSWNHLANVCLKAKTYDKHEQYQSKEQPNNQGKVRQS